MKTINTLALSIACYGMLAQAPNIEWQKAIGGSAQDAAHSIQQTLEGGYIIAGRSHSNDGDVTGNQGNSDYWIVKLDTGGNITWQKTFGGSGDDYAHSIQQTADGGYIIAGESNSNDGDVSGNHGGSDYWIVKLSPSGEITWQQSLGGSGADSATSIKQTIDGGYIVAGYSSSSDGDVTVNQGSGDYWIVKLNAAGGIEWQKSFGGSDFDNALSIDQTNDNGYIIAGLTNSNDGDVTLNQGVRDYWIVKLNMTGDLIWEKSLGGSGDDRAYSIKQTSNNNYIIGGFSSSHDGDVTANNGDGDCWIVNLNPEGNILWQKALGGSSTDTAHNIQETIDGGFIIAGYSASNDGDVTENKGGLDCWTVKLSPIGDIQWQKAVGGSGDELFSSIHQTADGGYIAGGRSNSTDGDVTENKGEQDYWIVKFESDPLSISQFKDQINIYPNPASSLLNISAKEPIMTISVYNLLGQKLMASSHNEVKVQLDISGLSPNVYMVVTESEEGTQAHKIIVR